MFWHVSGKWIIMIWYAQSLRGDLSLTHVNICEYFLELGFICSGMISLFIYLFVIHLIMLSIAKRALLFVE